MPGLVQQSVASTVLPYGLAAAFNEAYVWPVVSDGPYADGSENRRLRTAQPMRRWQLSRRLTKAETETLLTFYNTQRCEAFYFYPNLTEHDPAGIAEFGRVKVIFSGPLELSWGISRSAVSFGLEEVR